METKKKPLLGRRARANILTGVIIAAVYVLLQNLPAVRAFLASAYTLISPFVGGLVTAYLLGLVVTGLENLFLHRIRRKKLMRALSILLTLVLAALVIVGLIFAVIPQLIKSVTSLVIKAENFLLTSEPVIRQYAAQFGVDSRLVDAVFGSWDGVLEMLKGWSSVSASGLVSKIVEVGSSVGSGIVRGILSLFIAIYILADKERLARHAKLVIRAFASERGYDVAVSAVRRSHKIFSGFISGKLLDSLIIGVLCFIGMLIFRMPNAVLISVIVGVTNIIPTFGPVIGAVPSVLIILIDSPIKALYFLIFIIVLQQFDGNVLGPHILGDSTGLSALWVMVSICFFGALWGVVGMLVGVPITAILYVFGAEFVAARLEAKGYDLNNEKVAPPAADGGRPTHSPHIRDRYSRSHAAAGKVASAPTQDTAAAPEPGADGDAFRSADESETDGKGSAGQQSGAADEAQ